MGFYFRYLTRPKDKITIAIIEDALKQAHNQYQLHPSQINNYADLLYEDKLIAHIEINHSDEDIFQDDIDELSDTIGTPQNTTEQSILSQIRATTTLVVVETIWEDTQREAALDKLDPLWNWLFQHYPGILQADGEGFYNADGLVIARNFTL